ncbi:hypothetical protein CALCODRAFT_486677 [Calocera cornea HHB12733]|uniref:Uncharacterized protein n=1 Tax=Calocera cornea HHB12733 TaxID=1353952 RepID=A0A165DKZ2_9BASI|nr:hypothetical protein CALCODRAFT_486677 [Calocera cornea HHB12733]
MQFTLFASSLLLTAVGVAAQGPIIRIPGQIVSPLNDAHYLYGAIIPFAYNYTAAAEKLVAPPLVDVYVHKSGDEHYVEVAKNLDCSKSSCVNGILKHDLNLRDYTPLIGTGVYELWTVQENFSPFLINASRITTKTITGEISFTVELPLGGPVADKPSVHALTVQ